ncbi:hypothetical protein B0H13DRAFT_2363006 [Mycena leptocephala]|nr:hypothetical protein B0H13DRAFT_2363006 [Mycena leptocephala]
MLISFRISILLSAGAVMASTQAIPRRIDSSALTFTNKEMTWYPNNTGPDTCTGKSHLDSDFYVAMGFDQYGTDGSACCGKTATATCVDECNTCPDFGQLDLTKGLFEFFTNGDLGVGVIFASWSFVD